MTILALVVIGMVLVVLGDEIGSDVLTEMGAILVVAPIMAWPLSFVF